MVTAAEFGAGGAEEEEAEEEEEEDAVGATEDETDGMAAVEGSAVCVCAAPSTREK